jgi:hypothetical protein
MNSGQRKTLTLVMLLAMAATHLFNEAAQANWCRDVALHALGIKIKPHGNGLEDPWLDGAAYVGDKGRGKDSWMLEMLQAHIAEPEAIDAVDSFIKKFTLFGLWRPRIFDRFIKRNIADYLAFRKSGLEHTESLKLACEIASADYFRLRQEGVSHPEAAEAAREVSSIDEYLKLRRARVEHGDAIEVVEEMGNIDEYLQLRAMDIPHEDALTAALESDVSDYLRLRSVGATHDEALDAADQVDVDDYIRVRRVGINHEQVIEVVENYDVDKYMLLRRRGITHDEAIGVLE